MDFKKFNAKHLKQGEFVHSKVDAFFSGKMMGSNSKRSGLAILTDSRVVAYTSGNFFTGEYIASYPLTEIVSVEAEKNNGTTFLTVTANGLAGVTFQSTGQASNLMALAEIIREKMADTKKAESKAQPLQASADPLESLQKLKTMLESELITQEEYEATRNNILSKM